MTENELDLWKRFSQRDEAARKELILLYLPLVDEWAKRISRAATWANLKDLRQDGAMGLMNAIDRFDPNRGVEFKYFARRYIQGAIFDSSELTRDLSRQQEEICRGIKRAEAELTKILQRNPTIGEVAERMKLPVEKIRNAIDAKGIAFATDLSDSEDHPAATPKSETTVIIENALSHLSEREALIVRSFYFEDLPTEEIARRLGLTVSNVTKIRQRAIIKLRKRLAIIERGA